MSSSDWTAHTGSLGSSDVSRGVTQAFTPPSGGGSFTYAFHSLTNQVGAVCLSNNQTNFFPIAAGKGVSVRGALYKGAAEGGFTVMLYGAMEDKVVTEKAYLLGFTQDEEPAHLVLVKDSPSNGILSTNANILRTSTGTYAKEAWAHVRLDIIAQPYGDSHLQVFSNSGSVGSPTWTAIGGMAEYIDDKPGILSGSSPLSGGYAGYAYYTSSIGRWGLVDHMQVARQTA